MNVKRNVRCGGIVGRMVTVTLWMDDDIPDDEVYAHLAVDAGTILHEVARFIIADREES